MTFPALSEDLAQPDSGTTIDLLVVCRSATLRRCFASAAAARGMPCREVRDAFDAVALFAIGISLKQVVFVGPHALSDARAMQRRLATFGVAEVPMLLVADMESTDPPSVPVGTLDEVLLKIAARLPAYELMLPPRDDEECERQMEARRELNKAQALLLDVVGRVGSDDLPGPMMPTLLQQLRSKLRHPHLSLYDLAEFVKPHQALSARVMTLANSAHYARGVPATSLRQALPRIGLDRTGALLQAVATLEYEVGSDARTRALLRRLLKESYLTALLAENLAEACLHPQPSDAYTVGLFHNIGTTFLVYTYALLFDRGAVKPIEPSALQQIAVEHRSQLNGLLVKALELPDPLERLETACDAAAGATERLVVQAAWVAEHLLENHMETVEFCDDARILGIESTALDVVNRALPAIAESFAAFR